MKAVFRHELSSHLTNPTSYVFGAFVLLFAGIYTMAYNIESAIANFEYAIGSMAFVFLVTIPILTMRVLSEERRQKTDQLLYSLPLTMTKVVAGKFAALLVMLLLPMAIISLYPLVLSFFGNVYLPAAFGAIIGFFLLGAALLSIGMFVSSVTENQAVAAGLCFVVMLINFYIVDLANYVASSAFASFAALAIVALLAGIVLYLMTKNSFAALVLTAVLECALLVFYMIDGPSFSGLFPNLMKELSLFQRFFNFIDGVFDLTSVVYLLSVTGLFLFLSVQSLEKRRWSE